MSDLTPVGNVLVSVQAEDVTADTLRARIIAVRDDFKRHEDAEQFALQMGWLCLLAERKLRQMEESHAGPDLDRGGVDDLGGRGDSPPVRPRASGGWAAHRAAFGS